MEKNKMEDLAVLPDDELFFLLKRTKKNISYVERSLMKVRHSRDVEDLESLQVEMCYIQREAEVREKRRLIHEEYLQSRGKK